MSFGFGVGDFIAVGELCWKIYSRVYKVSRDASEELRALIQELGSLSNTVNLLNEEVRDREEWIKYAGERRLEYTCKVMGQAKETLEKMDRLADKYAELDPGVNSQGSKRSLRIQWNRIKFAFEVSSINELRAKFMSHNFHLTLLLQGAQNSSLERIEQQQTKTDNKLEELRKVLIDDRRSRDAPLLKGPLDEQVRAELSAAFLRSAETDNRPWASIGIDDWLQAGKWWLLKVPDESMIETHRHLTFDTNRLGPKCNIESKALNLKFMPIISLQISHGEVLFQCFAGIYRTAEDTVDAMNTPEECLLLLQVPQDDIYLNAILTNFVGHDICKLEHSDALEAILRGFQLFSSTFQPMFLTMSMVHSVSVLADWPSRAWNCLLLPDYDISCPARSDPLALLLRTIVDDVVKKGYEDKSPSSDFFARECLDVEFLPLGSFVWKVICWHCEKFADMKLRLEGFNIEEYLHNSLVQTAFLRLDHNFLSHLVHHINHRDEWHPGDVLIMVKAALSSNDTRHLLWILEHVTAKLLSGHLTTIFKLVYSSRRLDHIDAMMKVVVPRPADIAAALAWCLSSSDEQSFKDFLHMVKDRGGFFKGKTAKELDFSDFYPIFVAGCGRLIETQQSNTLSLYLDSLEGLGIDFNGAQCRKNTDSSKLAILPALVSPDPSFLRILLEREMVVADMEPFVMEMSLAFTEHEQVLCN
ncbi:hypothetical protein FACUT_9845 [Fusarium acutatum]|uniref:Uncharacterized protein n=1 Tax=Fusarium acutatum TaxID=78861 RepID=A0A8H4JJE5_9HYPO|nr:hypothetical protein FACUT_9845 [Fusarium acutatum]